MKTFREILIENIKVTVADYIDLANVGNNSMDVPNTFKPAIPSKTTIKIGDDIMLAGRQWGEVEKFLGKKVQVNLNPGMGNRPNIIKEPFDKVVAWKYKTEYAFVNKNRVIK
jgi:hypothetical protein